MRLYGRAKYRLWGRTLCILATGCWEWQGSLDAHGYGQLGGPNHVPIKAHRLAWQLTHRKPIPPGWFVCHHCDNPKCVRPSHLFIGTQKDNMHDAAAKGRVRWPQLTPPRGPDGRWRKR